MRKINDDIPAEIYIWFIFLLISAIVTMTAVCIYKL